MPVNEARQSSGGVRGTGAAWRESGPLARATLKSERQRIGLLLLVFAGLGAMIVVRLALAAGDERQLALLGFAGGVIVISSLYEWAVLIVVNRAIAADKPIRPIAWFGNVIVECSIPTVVLLIAVLNAEADHFAPLTSPGILAYPIFLILSTLRLNPRLCVLSGLTCALGHVIVFGITWARFGSPASDGFFTPIVYSTYPILLIGSGLVAAFVARRIRSHVSATLEEARGRLKIEADLETARTIQQGLLPSDPPVVDGYDIVGYNEPADETGGDYYHWQTLADGRVALCIADVTGHGVGPALLASASRAYLRAALAIDQPIEPMLESVNSALAADMASGRFVTCAIAMLDPKTGAVELLSAGHGPNLRYSSSSGEVTQYIANGVPLGIIESDVGYGPAERFILEPGDALVLVTDGIFEWSRADGEQFGTARLAACVVGKHRSAGELLESMRSAASSFAEGTPQNDDITAVVLLRTPGG